MKATVNMADRRKEIPRMIEILDKHKDWKSLTFFQYKGGNADLIEPITKIRLSSRWKFRALEYVLTIGRLNHAEQQYVNKWTEDRGRGDTGIWPDDFFQKVPKKRATN